MEFGAGWKLSAIFLDSEGNIFPWENGMAKRIIIITCLSVIIVALSSCVRSIPNRSSPSGATIQPLAQPAASIIPSGNATVQAANSTQTPGQATLAAELLTVVPQLSGTLVAPGFPPVSVQSPNQPFTQTAGGPSITATLLISATTYPYGVQMGAPVQTTNFLHPEAICNYTGVAGQAINAKGEPVAGLVVEIYGTLESRQVMTLTLTGSATTLGPAGYEVPLSDHLAASQGSLHARVYNVNGVPQTDIITFDTFADCERNLVILNFIELTNHSIFLPLIEWKARPVQAPWFDYFPLVEKFFRRRSP